MMGLVSEPAQTFDKQVTGELTNFLFPVDASGNFGHDLIARNIQRGQCDNSCQINAVDILFVTLLAFSYISSFLS